MKESTPRTGTSHRTKKKNLVTLIIAAFVILGLVGIAVVLSQGDDGDGESPKTEKISKKGTYKKGEAAE